MQNWILDYDFYKSASYLDRHRLQANIYENIHGLASLLNANNKLVNPKRSVKNHPNIKRWEGRESVYYMYIYCHIQIWYFKGYKSFVNSKNLDMIKLELINQNKMFQDSLPEWINDDLIKQHQQILLQKNHEHYSKYFGV